MRITTTTVNDFIRVLEAGSVWQNRVHFERSKRPINGKSSQDATSFEVFYQLSAVAEIGDGQALVQCGTLCGIDRLTADGGLEGTAELNKLHGLVEQWCKQSNALLLPGVLDQ